MNEREVAVRVAQRIGADASGYLRIQSMIPVGLERLAHKVANDGTRRHLLLTNKALASEAITSSNQEYYADLATDIGTFGIMLDYLHYGTVYHSYATKTWATGDVNTGNDRFSITAHGYPTGHRVRLTTSGGLPTGLETGTDYYIIRVSADILQFASSRANAIAGTAIDVSSVGAGTGTITSWEVSTVQWLNREVRDLNQSIPLNYVYGWLVGSKLFTNATSGTFSFTVPFVPTLLTLPATLEKDLINCLVEIVEAK